MDGPCLLAARFLCGPLSHVRRAPVPARATARSGKARSKGRQPEGAWKTAARGGAVPSRP